MRVCLGRFGLDAAPWAHGRESEADVVVLRAEGSGPDLTIRIKDLSRRGLPTVVILNRAGPAARLRALAAGAQDCLAPPLSYAELALRLRAIHRRRAEALAALEGARCQHAGTLQVGALCLDPVSRRAMLAGRPVRLTEKEFDLLWLLATRVGRVVSREVIVRYLWGGDHRAASARAAVVASRLRRKLQCLGEDPGIRIRARWGLGYRLEQVGPQLATVGPYQGSADTDRYTASVS